jgi:hypothetical protein
MSSRAALLCAAFCLFARTAEAAPACDASAAPEVPVIKGLTYDQARAALLAAGWKPGHGSKFDDMAVNQSVFHERGYTEVVSCDFDPAAACRFQFVGPGHVLLKVMTKGEESVLLDTKAMVTAAELGCEE